MKNEDIFSCLEMELPIPPKGLNMPPITSNFGWLFRRDRVVLEANGFASVIIPLVRHMLHVDIEGDGGPRGFRPVRKVMTFVKARPRWGIYTFSYTITDSEGAQSQVTTFVNIAPLKDLIRVHWEIYIKYPVRHQTHDLIKEYIDRVSAGKKNSFTLSGAAASQFREIVEAQNFRNSSFEPESGNLKTSTAVLEISEMSEERIHALEERVRELEDTVRQMNQGLAEMFGEHEKGLAKLVDSMVGVVDGVNNVSHELDKLGRA